MQVAPLQSYSFTPKTDKNTSFKSLKVHPDLYSSELLDPIDHEGIKSITQRLKNLLYEKFDLREIFKSENLTIQEKNMLERLFDMLGEEETSNLTVNVEQFLERFNPSESFNNSVYDNGIDFKIDLPNDNGIIIDSVSWTKEYKHRDPSAINYRTRVKQYDNGYDLVKKQLDRYTFGLFYAIPTVKTLRKRILVAVKEKIDKMIKDDNVAIEAIKKGDALKELKNLTVSRDDGNGIGKNMNIPAKDMLPVASVVCEFGDIYNYLMKHVMDIDYGRIFNKPVTKDGESLLIALAHIQPDKDNMDSYISLVNNMRKMPFIDYNQKDTMGVQFIAHVLNSQNKLLFAAVTNCKDLKYDPLLENEFNNIIDPDFKKLVQETPIFENGQNSEYEMIFGKPNPLYKNNK